MRNVTDWARTNNLQEIQLTQLTRNPHEVLATERLSYKPSLVKLLKRCCNEHYYHF